MTAKVTPLPQKINLDPDHTININASKNGHIFLIYFIAIIPNTVSLFASAYGSNDYSMAIFTLLFFSVFVLVDCCLPMYLSMPKTERSIRKLLLKVTMWCLCTIISFAFVYLYSYFLSPHITMALFYIALVGNVVLLYAFIIADLISDWKIREYEELRSVCVVAGDGESNGDNSVMEKV